MEITYEMKQELLKEHFCYEVRMLEFSAKQYSDKKTLSDNMALECFLLHARNLYEFYFSFNKFPDGAKASHFVKNEQVWKQKLIDIINNGYTNPKISIDSGEQEIKNAIELPKMHKRLSHLSYDRAGNKKDWKIRAILDILLKIEDKFVENLQGKYTAIYDKSKNQIDNKTITENGSTNHFPVGNGVKIIEKEKTN